MKKILKNIAELIGCGGLLVGVSLLDQIIKNHDFETKIEQERNIKKEVFNENHIVLDFDIKDKNGLRTNGNHIHITYNYGDAIEALSKSGMSSMYKSEAISKVKRNESSEYYKAICSLAKSGMSGMYINDTIKHI